VLLSTTSEVKLTIYYDVIFLRGLNYVRSILHHLLKLEPYKLKNEDHKANNQSKHQHVERTLHKQKIHKFCGSLKKTFSPDIQEKSKNFSKISHSLDKNI
jgi:ubiquitin C-terminal hydrolase